VRQGRRTIAALGLLLAASVGACNSCDKKKTKSSPKRMKNEQCVSAADCADDDPCTIEQCDDSECFSSAAPAGTSCENETVCDGVSKCDGNGQCVAGTAPTLDDGNACTIDACDPVTGVTHTPLALDDFDACTEDTCDPRSGTIGHNSIDIDDGDDCTFDSCDKRSGVKHQKPDSTYSCSSGCGPGFHAASRAKSASCAGAMQTFCVPDCGNAFYVCDTRCPGKYHASSRASSPQCGDPKAAQTFCQKNTGDSFYSCESNCPEGYQRKSVGENPQCGEPAAQVFCVKS
jgi:hypothetical protein